MNRCGWGSSCQIQLGTHAAPRERWRLVTLPRLLKRILLPILNQYMLVKEIGLNIEKYKEQEKGTPLTTTESLVTLCFCLFFLVLVFSHCEIAFNSFILNKKFILIHSTYKIQKLEGYTVKKKSPRSQFPSWKAALVTSPLCLLPPLINAHISMCMHILLFLNTYSCIVCVLSNNFLFHIVMCMLHVSSWELPHSF